MAAVLVLMEQLVGIPSFPKTLVLAQQLFVCSHHLYVLCGSIFEYKHHVQCVDDAHYGGIWYAARLL